MDDLSLIFIRAHRLRVAIWKIGMVVLERQNAIAARGQREIELSIRLDWNLLKFSGTVWQGGASYPCGRRPWAHPRSRRSQPRYAAFNRRIIIPQNDIDRRRGARSNYHRLMQHVRCAHGRGCDVTTA